MSRKKKPHHSDQEGAQADRPPLPVGHSVSVTMLSVVVYKRQIQVTTQTGIYEIFPFKGGWCDGNRIRVASVSGGAGPTPILVSNFIQVGQLWEVSGKPPERVTSIKYIGPYAGRSWL